eukprot:TRINITY_DN9263_c0_g1_i1.p1 TRINITY_DN9263_c0_g1~~TRINITY_DN9263_c0_g1_i1.p1  ORF type:complete len:377 (-),score=78.04 TRINITY_DN9263_c0_g1_i1:44-1174(-)
MKRWKKKEEGLSKDEIIELFRAGLRDQEMKNQKSMLMVSHLQRQLVRNNTTINDLHEELECVQYEMRRQYSLIVKEKDSELDSLRKSQHEMILKFNSVIHKLKVRVMKEVAKANFEKEKALQELNNVLSGQRYLQQQFHHARSPRMLEDMQDDTLLEDSNQRLPLTPRSFGEGDVTEKSEALRKLEHQVRTMKEELNELESQGKRESAYKEVAQRLKTELEMENEKATRLAAQAEAWRLRAEQLEQIQLEQEQTARPSSKSKKKKKKKKKTPRKRYASDYGTHQPNSFAKSTESDAARRSKSLSKGSRARDFYNESVSEPETSNSKDHIKRNLSSNSIANNTDKLFRKVKVSSLKKSGTRRWPTRKKKKPHKSRDK